MNELRHLLVAALVGATLSTGVCAGVIGGILTERAGQATVGPVPAAVVSVGRPALAVTHGAAPRQG